MSRERVPHLVVVGGGFAGLWATRALARERIRITLVDRRNHHLFQPLLYQVATAGLSAPDIAAPLRHILGHQRNVEVRLGEVVAIDKQARQIGMADGSTLDYDSLLLATGATHAYFGNDQWADDAPGLKTLDDAIALRRKLLLAFERAEAEPDPARKAAWLSFAIVGGGPTGVELAGTLAEIARHTLRNEFRHIDPASAKVRLVEAGPRVLSSFPEVLSLKARRQLEKLGVEVLTGGTHERNLWQPTVLAAIQPTMRVSCQEVFAPLIGVYRYSDVRQAIAAVDDSDFGLQAGLFTNDWNVIQAAFDDIEVGGLMINDVSTFRIDHMPYGGAKQSGVGREGLRYAIEEMSELKLLMLNQRGR